MITNPKLLIGLTIAFTFLNWVFSMADPSIGGWGFFGEIAGGDIGMLDFTFWWNLGDTMITGITWEYSIFEGNMFGTVVKMLFVCISIWIILSFLFEVAKFIRGFIPFLGS